MKLNLIKAYKSIEKLQTSELPDFVIISGVNGSGKTQLLEGIAAKSITANVNNTTFQSIKFVRYASLVPNDGNVINPEKFKQDSQKAFQVYNNYKNSKKNDTPHRRTGQISDAQIRLLVDIIAKETQKNVDNLEASDFYNHYPINFGAITNDVFHQNFSLLFKRYHVKYHENKYNKFLCQEEGMDYEYLSDDKFTDRYGEPPWIFINKILDEANLDYYIISPENQHKDAPFQVKLKNRRNEVEINFSDLSGGEKVLMSLALSIYNSQFDIKFPELLLLDEPESPLHPSMTKQFLNVLNKVFVKDKGIKIIMTTHSPSTVALAPESSLYIMNKEEPRLEKTTKDKVLKILTAGVPSLSINYENRRQVFVESSYDAVFYEKIHRKLTSYLNPEISLTFISSGDSKTDKNGIKVSNCGQVISIAKTLREAGNNLIWGIIDWDTENNSNDYVKVIGNGNRYSIESYIFDPILVAALLLREKIISREELGLTNNQTYIDFKTLPQDKLQRIVNYIVNKISSKVNSTDTTNKQVKFINGQAIEVPVWYLHHQGHKLEDIIISIFPALNSIKRNKEDALKNEIIDKVIDDIPELISKDFLDVFTSVQR